MDLSDHRTSYDSESIDVDSLAPDPFVQFGRWFEQAQLGGDPEPYAFVLATAGKDQWPASRTVLLRSFDDRGFVFYTNYRSTKAQAIEATGRAAMTFIWHGLHRQVHVSGSVDRVSAAESDEYFKKRPRGSQLGAWASDQSSVISGREELDAKLAEVTDRFEGVEVPRPEFWGGYRIQPRWVEFWQGQPSRLHDRVRYAQTNDGEWERLILSP